MRIQPNFNPVLYGYLAAFISSLSYGIGAVVTKKVVTDIAAPMITTAYSLLFGTLIMAAIFTRHAYNEVKDAPKNSLINMSLAGIAGLWGAIFYHLALLDSQVILVTPVSSTYPLIAIIMTSIFLRQLEKVHIHTVIGAIIVVAGVALISLGQTR